MDGRGRYIDNIFIERVWRSLKQEAISLEEIGDGFPELYQKVSDGLKRAAHHVGVERHR